MVTVLHMRSVLCVLLFAWLCIALPAREHRRTSRQRSAATHTPAIADRKRELQSLQQSIAEDRKRIASLRDQERSTMNAIQQMRRHSANIRRYMALLEAEIESLQDAADSASLRSASTADHLSRVHGGYAGLARSMSGNSITGAGSRVPATVGAGSSASAGASSGTSSGTSSDARTNSSTGTAHSAAHSAVIDKTHAQEDAVVLRRITKGARTTSGKLSVQRDSLSAASIELRSRSERRAALLATKNSEQKELEKMVAMTERALASIRSNAQNVAEQLRKNKASASQVQNAIATMVAREEREQRALQSQRAARGASRAARGNNINSAGTRGAAGSFNYPVASRKILHSFGTYHNNVTNTMANNPGVDIETPAGSTVRSIAAGTVTLVSWLPGYMSVVIVDHHNGYRSVYANLSSVRVRKGQALQSQAVVGSSGESFDGEFVHLQIWRNKERINPLPVLR
jgi:septal ring factor EnvC (AmiA/AmiB activator)